MKASYLAVALMLVPAPALAQASSDGTQGQEQVSNRTENATETAESEDPNRRICRRVETNTGSRVPFRTICLTARQWRTYRPN